MISLTPRQADLLRFLHSYQAAHGLAPTFDETHAWMRYSGKGHIGEILDRLAERGYIRRRFCDLRAIELLTEAPPSPKPYPFSRVDYGPDGRVIRVVPLRLVQAPKDVQNRRAA